MSEAEWREAFSCFAEPHLKPGEGTISTRDLGVLLRALGKSPTQEELQKLIAEVDPKGESNVDFKTLCHCMKKPMRQPDSENDVLEAFRAFDKDSSGTISTAEFQTVMRNFGEALNDEEVDELLKAAASCEAQPGVFNYGQLTKVLMARR